MKVVVQDDDPYHDSKTEGGGILVLEPCVVLAVGKEGEENKGQGCSNRGLH